MSTEKLVAPPLPKGYFFRVSIDRVNDTVVEIFQRKERRWWLWRRPAVTVQREYTYATGRRHSPARILQMMELVKDRLEHSIEDMAIVNNYLGDYPPKKELE